MLVLLSQLAHNLIRWISSWLCESVEPKAFPTDPKTDSVDRDFYQLVTKTLSERGIKRFVHQILGLSGKVVFFQNQVNNFQ